MWKVHNGQIYWAKSAVEKSKAPRLVEPKAKLVGSREVCFTHTGHELTLPVLCEVEWGAIRLTEDRGFRVRVREMRVVVEYHGEQAMCWVTRKLTETEEGKHSGYRYSPRLVREPEVVRRTART